MISKVSVTGRQPFVQVRSRRSLFMCLVSVLQEDRAGVYPRSVRWPARHRDLLAIGSKHAVPCRENDP